MTPVLPSGINREGKLFSVEVHYRGRVAKALEPSLIAAEIRKGQLLNELVGGGPVAIPPPNVRPWTLQNAYDRTVEMVWRDTRGGHSAMRNAQSALQYFGRDTLVREITSHHIDLWIQALRKLDYSNGSVNRHISALSKIIRFAHLRGATDQLPIIIRRPELIGRTRYLSDDEERRIFELLPNIKWHCDWPLFRFLLDTGMRIGEALKLEERDVNLKQRLVHVWVNKSDKPRSIPMTVEVHRIIRERLTGDSRRRLFPHQYAYYQKIWKLVRTTMGLLDDLEFVIHCLRHTCAARLVQRGVPLLVVQEWMGHRTFISTLRYAHLAPKNLREAAGALDQPAKERAYRDAVKLQDQAPETKVKDTLAMSRSPVHPGAILREDIVPTLGKNLGEMAADLGTTKSTLSRILSERLGISADMALRLGKYLGNGPEFWMALQGQYELAMARKEIAKELLRIPRLRRSTVAPQRRSRSP
jgi:addiction module HigA family antidote